MSWVNCIVVYVAVELKPQRFSLRQDADLYLTSAALYFQNDARIVSILRMKTNINLVFLTLIPGVMKR